ncbi:MAG: FAD-dependent oxidoreductase, partial [Burkholderiaceae bacterium]
MPGRAVQQAGREALPADGARRRIAVVGAGVSGLACAWLLSQRYKVTLYEAGNYLGGHTNTVDVTVGGISHPVDTGFLVFNHHTYPNLTAMLDHLQVDSVATDMSFAVSLDQPDLEWAGSSLGTVFGQKR